MTDNDKKFVDAVNRWRNENDINKQILDFLDEMVDTISDEENCDNFDDGFDSCVLMFKHKIREILNN